MSKVCDVEGCKKTHEAKGFCRIHYSRFRRHGDPLAGGPTRGHTINFLKDLSEKPTNKCVIWPFSSNGNGYGQISYEGRPQLAHRVALILLTGTNPKGLVAAHGPCHNRLCVNPHPEHGMRWATNSENQRDKHRDGTMIVGEQHHCSKLKPEQVLAIRFDDRLHSEIAGDYGVHAGTISEIKRNLIWRHLA